MEQDWLNGANYQKRIQPSDCPDLLAERSVCEMHGTSTKKDIELFKEAYASANGDLRMARIIFNKIKTSRDDGERSALWNVVKIASEQRSIALDIASSDLGAPAKQKERDEVETNPLTEHEPTQSENDEDSGDDIPLRTASYKRQQTQPGNIADTTESWLSSHGLDTLVNMAFIGVISPGVYVTGRRDCGNIRGITVFYSKGRRGKETPHGLIMHDLQEQVCPGMKQLTRFIKIGRRLAIRKGGQVPQVSPEEVFNELK